WAGMCSTTNTAAGRSAGSRPRMSLRGAVAPAEPPITMMSRLLMEPASRTVLRLHQGGPANYVPNGIDSPFWPLGQEMTTRAENPGPLAGRRILVVEDEYFLADDIVRALSALGARIVGPYGGLDEAAGVVDSDAVIDAAIMDINLRNEMAFP